MQFNATLQYPIEPVNDLTPHTLQLNFLLSFMQSFALTLLSQLSDQSIISFILIQTATNTLIAFLSCSMSSICLIFLFSLTGYGLSLCLPSQLIDIMAVISFFFAAIFTIKQGRSQRALTCTFEDDYLIKRDVNQPKLDLRRQLSVIQELNKEDSKSLDDIAFPLFERLGSCGCIDQKEEIDNVDMPIVFETMGKLIISDWLNQSYFYVLVISMLFDLRAALPGMLTAILLQFSIGNCFWSAIKQFIPRQIDLLLAGLLVVSGIQILFINEAIA